MNPQDLSAYLTNLLRSGPENVASFLMGVLLTGMFLVACRRWLFPGGVMPRETAKRDIQIAKLKRRLAEKDALLTALRPGDTTTPAVGPASAERLAELEAENGRLAQTNRSLEETVAGLRTELGQAADEIIHLRRWLQVFAEDSARSAEAEPASRE